MEVPHAEDEQTARVPLDGPQLELDGLLRQLADRAQDVTAAQARLRALLRAHRMVGSDRALPVVLRRLVEAACELVQAPYGALTVLRPGGGLEHFIQVGVDDDTAARINGAPEGAGLLGAVANLLGVPIRVREEVLGGLYLAGHDGVGVNAEDEELVSSLAATAGVAIENARLFDESRRRQVWLQASTAITRQLLSNEGEEPLRVIARRLQQVADGDAVNVVLPTLTGGRLMVEVATGLGADQLTALTYPVENTVSQLVIDSGKPVLIDDMAREKQLAVHLSDVVPVGPLMVLPLVGLAGVRGALVVGRLTGRPRFTPADLDMATAFANHAAIALELADARTDRERLALLEDRDRIARDLHDHVMQRLFGAGLSVESVASALGSDPRADRLVQVVDDIDETIRQIRISIFQLRGPFGPQAPAVRTHLLAVAAEVAPVLRFEPRMSFAGPVDALVPDTVLQDLIAVLREGLTNVARHARASQVDVEVKATSGAVVLQLTDDGVGMQGEQRRSGLANLRRRAEQHGGALVLVSPLPEAPPNGPGGTCLQWTVPLQ
jgi:two-component system, NarL family, sensor histidine kinase DevS